MTNNERELRRDLVEKMYVEEGRSINEISKEIGVSWETIKRDLIARNVEIISRRNQFGKCDTEKNLFLKINDADSAYWLGFLYADGNIRKDRNEISLCLKESDLKTIEDFHNYCNNPNKIRVLTAKKNGKEYKSYVSSFSDISTKENLIKLGCVPAKSLILKFPTEQQVPDEYLYDFLRGYIDGDGYIQYDYSKHRYRIIICGTKEFLQGVVKRFNLFENYYILKDNNSSIYTLTISNKQNVYNFLEKLYENSHYHLLRKYDIYEQANRAHNK